ncbi:M48 family metalloprotease [Candidatus Daviesbacteria bacterium]|nr:M48 family metalloprotease [Candidatus Daviesbacteria bacterium]
MAVRSLELAPVPLPKAIFPEIKTPSLSIFRRENKETETALDDEFRGSGVKILRPLRPVTITKINEKLPPDDPGRAVIVDVTGKLEEEFEYLSRTRSLEMGTPRTILLEKIVAKMTEDTGIKARVVIINKGEDPEAFVMPDETIFISQTLLNKLDTLDEIAAVLGHEIGHIVNKTFEMKEQADITKELGVGWIHEAASDHTIAVPYLVKAGFNSLAFSSAIYKISHSHRGVIHQTGLARASQSIGAHQAVHYETSHIKPTAKPAILQLEAKSTNLEIMRKILDEPVPELTPKLKEFLGYLHPQDLAEVYQLILNKSPRSLSKYQPLLSVANELISERLINAGYNQAEMTLFLACWGETYSGYSANLYLFKSPQTLLDIAEILEQFDQANKTDAMAKLIFEGRSKAEPLSQLLSFLEHHIWDISFYDVLKKKPKYPILTTDDSLLEILAKITSVQSKKPLLNNLGSGPTKVLTRYINLTHLLMAREAEQEVDEDQIRDLFTQAKEMGITMDESYLRYSYVDGPKKGEQVDKTRQLYIKNQETVKRVIYEVYGFTIPIEEAREVNFGTVDAIFEDFNNPTLDSSQRGRALDTFLYKLGQYFYSENISNGERLKYLRYIDSHIERLTITTRIPILQALDDLRPFAFEKIYTETPVDDPELNNRLFKFNLKSFFALSLISEDSDQFFDYLKNIMEQSGIDLKKLSRWQLINLCHGYLIGEPNASSMYGLYGIDRLDWKQFEWVKIRDFERFSSLPFIREILSREAVLSVGSFEELNQYAQEMLRRSHFRFMGFGGDNKYYDFFSDSLHSIFLGQDIRLAVTNLVQRGLREEDLSHLYGFIDNYYPKGISRDSLLREINKLYLNSAQVSIQEKTEYLIKYFDQVGLEGMVIVASQIEDLETYKQFRGRLKSRIEEYLRGAGIVTTVAATDYASSFFSGWFGNLFETARADIKTKVETSTSFARGWLEHYFNPDRKWGVSYDPSIGKFTLGEGGRAIFETVADNFTLLRNLSPLKRFSVAHKALTDQHGAFANPENRKTLAEILVSSLGLKPGFVSSALTIACQEADAKMITFPVASMLAPLLFRAYDVNSVIFSQLAEVKFYNYDQALQDYKYTQLTELLPASDFQRVLISDTRAVTFFGSEYRYRPNSVIAQLAQESDRQYYKFTDQLKTLLNLGQEEKVENGARERTIDPKVEAIIKGVESAGAVGSRALQLTAQLLHTSPAIAQRLSESFDSRPGLNKLLFWENLYQLAEKDPEVREFLADVRVGEYLGGGSLYTTYAATKGALGEEEEIVLKMLNPNAEAFIESSAAIARDTLGKVASRNRGGIRQYARTGILLVNLAEEWCSADIKDPTFIEDDDKFKEVIASFNRSLGGEIVYSPDRVFNSYRLKSEKRAHVQTVNKFLNDPSVNFDQKKELVAMLGQFFVHQLKADSFTDEQGRENVLVLSDPHVGNSIVEIINEKFRLAIIDRHMYLKLSVEDLEVLKPLITGGNYNDFIYSFLGRVMDLNSDKVKSKFDKTKITGKIIGIVAKEYAFQRVRGSVDRFSLMRTILEQLANEGLDVPLRLRLMIRNIGAFKELMQKYDLKLEDYY